jgi:hypothetical protein
MPITRLTGGNTPADGADPRTFPAIWNGTADDLEAGDYSKVPTGGSAGEVLAKVSATDYDAGWVRRAAPWTPLSGASYGAFSSTTTAPALDEVHFLSVYFPVPTSVAALRCEVTVAGAAGAVVRLGLYAQGSNGRPGALIVDAGTVSSESTGIKEIAVTETVEGLVWTAVVAQGAVSTLRSTAGAAIPNETALSAGSLALNVRSGPRQTGVSGALPSTASASSDVTPVLVAHVKVA